MTEDHFGNPSRPVPPEAFTREETYRATRLPVDLASTLIPDAYTSAEFLALERERVFARSWVPVCVADELAEPGSFVVADVGGTSLIVCRSRAGELRAWKLVAENFMEYYHLPWVHPGLVKVSPMKAHHRWQGTGMYVGFCTSPIASNADEGGWQGLPATPCLDEDDAVSARFAWVFPNVAVNTLPNHTFLLLPRATAPGRSSEVAYLLAHPESIERAGESLEAEVDGLLAFWDEVNREDIAIVERVQLGLSDPAYTGGRMCYRFEEPVHRFQNMLIDRVLGIRRIPPGDDVPAQPTFPEPAATGS